MNSSQRVIRFGIDAASLEVRLCGALFSNQKVQRYCGPKTPAVAGVCLLLTLMLTGLCRKTRAMNLPAFWALGVTQFSRIEVDFEHRRFTGER